MLPRRRGLPSNSSIPGKKRRYSGRKWPALALVLAAAMYLMEPPVSVWLARDWFLLAALGRELFRHLVEHLNPLD